MSNADINIVQENIGSTGTVIGKFEMPAKCMPMPDLLCESDTKGNVEKIFIVHGHDALARSELKNYLQNILKYPEPIILSEKILPGKTIIETFEEVAADVGVVFVLLTPDDFVENHPGRARQNVIFELGYFMGKFGRKSGRVIVLLKGDVDIPSDLLGVFYICIDQGIMAAGENIRRALRAVQ